MIALLLAVALAHAGPWVRDPGQHYAKAEIGGFLGQAGAAPEGSPGGQQRLTYRDVRAALYGEVGVRKGVHLTGYLPYVVGWNDGGRARYLSASGGDAELGVTARLASRPALSVEARGRIPLYGDRTARRVESYGSYAFGFPQPGDGSVDLEAWAHAGTSWAVGSVEGWIEGSTGYRYRFGPWVDGVLYSGTVGWSPSFGWVGLGVAGVQNVVADDQTRQHTAVLGKVGVRFAEELAVEGFASWLPVTRNSSRGMSVGIGTSWAR